ncbi:hypothetical protein [Clostridium tunisiense]|uniref:hypothetical protein n=1 Tax=Clostridium tunisiense TaxID=219748 RepID=UPI0002D63A26|nr:hypothetical protein [Clostridium tunisiense]
MIKLTIFEFFIRGIPEAFLFVFATYTFSKTPINIRRFLLSGIIMAAIGFFTRYLPIHYGVHTILNLFAFVILFYNVNKIDLMKCIRSVAIAMFLQSFCELINIVIIQFLFKQDMDYILSIPKLKTLYGAPSMIIFGIVVISYYIIIKKRS